MSRPEPIEALQGRIFTEQTLSEMRAMRQPIVARLRQELGVDTQRIHELFDLLAPARMSGDEVEAEPSSIPVVAVRIGELALTSSVIFYLLITGNLQSIFLAFWLVVSIFCGLFGLLWGALPTLLAAIGYGIYLFIGQSHQLNSYVSFTLIFILPVILSYFIWRAQGQTHSDKDQAFDVLTRELTQASSTSDIVISSINDGVIAIDKQGVITLINNAGLQMIGWGKEDAVGLDYRSVLKLVDNQGVTLPSPVDPVQQCLTTNQKVTSDVFRLTTTSKKYVAVNVDVSPVGHSASGAIVVFRDITDQLEENRQRTEFISTASHEMRTPVAAIEGYLGLALNPATATIDDKAREYIGKAHESAQHLGRLFQDLLDVSRAEDGRLAITMNVIDITDSIRNSVLGFAPKAQEKGLTLSFSPDDSQRGVRPTFRVHADADRLQEVVGNLVENAIKYTPSGSVEVDVTGDESKVRIIVTDSGIGIPAEDIPHLFQKFYRVDNSDTREIGGTGLGLFLSRQLVEKMGGHLTVESEYKKGSRFIIDFPRVSEQDADTIVEQTIIGTPGASSEA